MAIYAVKATKDSQSLEILIMCVVYDLDLHHWRASAMHIHFTCLCAKSVSSYSLDMLTLVNILSSSVAEHLAWKAKGPWFDFRQLHLSFLLFRHFKSLRTVMA